ncbi:SDR family NAD(P)-dependent oxidoreductase [Deinococcus sp.]|uniref:SDR family NAD(P)-dependent oxidoreductase n=1 Tax=Deinococcus sp. TaxID=47478 RepID=UPI003C7D976D
MTVSHEIGDLVVVSGASTGIGAATAREFARRGHHVLAGVRRESDGDRLRAERIEPVILDITRAADIAAVAARVAADPLGRRLRAVVNNAAIAINAPVETLPLSEWRRLFEVNLFGHIALTQALLPALHVSRGRVVNVSSVGGKVSMATYGPYAATKFALEAVSDSLRRELAPLGVQVVVIEPGGVRTEMASSVASSAALLAADMTPEQRGRYGDLLQAVVNQQAAFTGSGMSPERVARVIAAATATARPRTRYTVGRDAATLSLLAFILPDRVLDWILALNLRSHDPKRGPANREPSGRPAK